MKNKTTQAAISATEDVDIRNVIADLERMYDAYRCQMDGNGHPANIRVHESYRTIQSILKKALE